MKLNRPIRRIIIHHTFTSDGITVNWQAIRRYHVEKLHWKDIGYHFGVEWVRKDYEVLVGRPLDMVGAHTKCLNRDSIGVAIVGNFNDRPPTNKQLYVLINRIIVPLVKIFNIPLEMIQGHREAFVAVKYEGRYPTYCLKQNKKSCPGWSFSMANLRNILKNMGLNPRDKKYLKELDDFDREAVNLRKVFW